jgi:hypothetical protein
MLAKILTEWQTSVKGISFMPTAFFTIIYCHVLQTLEKLIGI